MIYICDFYAHQKEAVSNQIEILRSKTNGTLFAAGIFMGQKFLRIQDIKEKRFVFPRFFFYLLRPLVIIFSKKGIHIFEEDPSWCQMIFLNLSRSPLYISLYRRPTPEYIAYLKQLKSLRTVFVEMELHKKLLVEQGIPRNIIEVVHPPALFRATPPTKLFTPDNIHLLFASWNKGNYQALSERGIIFLLEALVHNQYASLSILLRDHETALLERLASEKGLLSRIHLVFTESPEELPKYYQAADFVVFPTTKRITKDIPNSVLDGFSQAKPCIISTAIDFATVVSQEDLGFILYDTLEVPSLQFSEKQYRTWSANALRYALRYTQETYGRITEHYTI